jgi:hypothetical protein
VNWIGVAGQDQWVNGQLTVHTGEVQALTAAVTITAGASFHAAAGGQSTALAPGDGGHGDLTPGG